jgi:hypothetical protein
MEYSTNDIRYFLVVLASEEAYLKEVLSESQKRNISLALLKEILQNFVEKGIVGFMSLNGDDFRDSPQSESLKVVSNFDHTIDEGLQLYLTESGLICFDEDDWGISVERAREIVFK